MSDDFPTDGPPSTKKPASDFGTEFEFDTEGMEPGLELDLSGIEPKEPEPQPEPPPAMPMAPGPPGAPGAPGPGAPHPGPGQPQPGGAPGAGPNGPERRQPPRRPPPPVEQPNPAIKIAVVAAALLLVVIIGASMFGGDDEPAQDPAPVLAMEAGERAFHQGDWIEALREFRTLRRFPASQEAQSVRERKLEAQAIAAIMEAEPSSTTIQRLEALAELFPDKPEVRTRLGEVRKALSSGARAVPDEEEGSEEEPAE